MYASSFQLDNETYTAMWDGVDHPDGNAAIRYVEVSHPDLGAAFTYKLIWHTREGWVRNGDLSVAEPACKALGFGVWQ